MDIVQVGCNDCQDHVKEFVDTNHQDIKQLILIDPGDKLCECNSVYDKYDFTLKKYNKAVTADETVDTITVYDSKARENGGFLMSVNKQHLIDHQHPEDTVFSLDVPAVHLHQIFEENNLTKIDRLYVDAEGYDADIIQSLDFDKYQIDFIRFELLHIGGTFSNGKSKKAQDFIRYLYTKGYTRMEQSGYDVEVKR